MITTSTRFIIASLIFLCIFCFLGLPFTEWWFNGDDFSGLALGKNMQTIKTFFYHVLHGNVNIYTFPSNHQSFVSWNSVPQYQNNFMSVYYRPIQCIYLAITHLFLGLNGYAYYLINVFLHSFNTATLFCIFSSITSPVMAILWALFFAFHPQIGFRFGHLVNFQYYINFIFLIGTILFFKNYLETHKKFFLFFSCFFFMFSIFTRETGFILPLILFIGGYLYTQKISFFPIIHLSIALFYLMIRIFLYPFSNTLTVISLLPLIKQKYNEFLYLIYDTFGLSWLPYGHMKIRFFIIASILCLGLYLFLKNTHKIWLVFFTCCYLLMLWPSIIGFYSPRYYYEAAPFILIVFILLTKNHKFSIFSKVGTIILTTFIIISGIFTYQNLKIREKKLSIVHNAFQKLKLNNQITKGTRPLCFLAFPIDGLGSCIEQAAWLYLTPYTTPIYYDPSTMFTQIHTNILENKTWFMQCSTYYGQNYHTLTKVRNGIRITSTNPHMINFSLENKYLSMGEKIIYQTTIINREKVATDFSLIFDEKYLQEKPLIIVWNYEKKEFKIIDIFNS